MSDATEPRDTGRPISKFDEKTSMPASFGGTTTGVGAEKATIANRADGRLDRRGFLHRSAETAAALSAAAAAVGMPAANCSLQAAERRRDRPVRLGVVGGRFGATFQWHEHPDCIVQSVSDLRPERRDRLMKVYGCPRSHESLEKMILDPSIEAVAIFTEAPNHVRHSVAALEAGKHVVCAVPAAMTLEECQQLIEAVERTGLTFMMAETSYWQQPTISARKFYAEQAFGTLYAANSMYRHPGLESLWFENGKPTWRHGFPPMHYPTHCTAHLIGVTGERLVEVTCHGWGDDHPALANNPYNNPFWNETAEFKTDRGHAFHVEVWWAGAHRGCERAEWYGDKMSFLSATPYGQGPMLVHASQARERDSGGFDRAAPKLERYQQPEWWRTDLLPEPLRHNSGHHGSHTFITHEFIASLMEDRRPAVDVYEAVAYTAPGIVAHQSALRGGERLKIPQFDRPGRQS